MSPSFPTLIGIIGSLASVGAIPLSIWLYLRSQEERLTTTRREILHILSYQLGEGRPLTLFEIHAVIESKTRAKKLKLGLITPKQIVDDLVTDTIANPLLHSGRKAEILSELESALLYPPVGRLLVKYRLRPADILHFLDTQGVLKDPDRRLLTHVEGQSGEAAATVSQDQETEGGSDIAGRARTFALMATVTSLLAFLAEVSTSIPTWDILPSQTPLSGLVYGGVAALIAALAVFLREITVRRGRTDPDQDHSSRGVQDE